MSRWEAQPPSARVSVGKAAVGKAGTTLDLYGHALVSKREDAAAMVDAAPETGHTKARAKPAGHNSAAALFGGKIQRIK